MELLITVEDHFLIKGRGLLVHHVIDNPNDWRFNPFSDEVVIRRPDGAEERFLVSFGWGWGHGIGDPPMIYGSYFPKAQKKQYPLVVKFSSAKVHGGNCMEKHLTNWKERTSNYHY